MINRLSNLINRNRSAAKISQVLCSNIDTIIEAHVHRYLGQKQLYDHREEVDDTKEETTVSLLRFSSLLFFLSSIKMLRLRQ